MGPFQLPVLYTAACIVLVVQGNREGDVRLVAGGGPASGRVEFFYDGVWGTVCADGWDHYAAEVVCKQLGLYGGWPLGGGYFQSGEGATWIDDTECTGKERRLADCRHAPYGMTDCTHEQDAGVICGVRLSGGNRPSEGFVQLEHAGVWGHVCDPDWGVAEANVVCRELGYFRGLPAPNRVFNAQPERFWLEQIECRGDEGHLSECPHGPWGRYGCDRDHVGTVVCEDFKMGLSIQGVRLGGSRVGHRGRVEVKVDNEWGTICDDGWDRLDSQVVCRQLGYQAGGVEAARGVYGPGDGTVWLSRVSCSGREESLAQCRHAGFGRNACSHTRDVAVMCNAY